MSLTHGSGRYAPTPSGDLHIGNLRTAILAWSFARQSGKGFHIRVEDTDRNEDGIAQRQLADLARIGVDWDEPVVYQHTRTPAHNRAIETLIARGDVFECYCSRKDIRLATQAPNGTPGRYPGTCRDLSATQRKEARKRLADQGRAPALRLRAGGAHWTIKDAIFGRISGMVDDVVIRRGDGMAAYNLAVVVDDAWAGIDQICRGDDLLTSAISQSYIAHLLGLEPVPTYYHVPLVVGEDGKRLAKRDGAVTCADLMAVGWSVEKIVREIGASLGVDHAHTASDICESLSLERLRRGRGKPWVFPPPAPVVS